MLRSPVAVNRENTAVLEPTSERMVPESSDQFTFWEHVYRYAFACRFVKNKRVLDIACGEGYGAAALRKAGASDVIAVDASEHVCLHVRRKYGLDVKRGSAEQIPIADRSVDVIVSFETIEHVPNPHRFLDECVRVLVPGGRLVISTPDKVIYGRAVQNPYHCSEMTAEQFASALNSRFYKVDLYTQRPDSAAWWSPRTIPAANPPWGFIRGSRRFRNAIQSLVFPEATKGPSDKRRQLVTDTILKLMGKRFRPLNPYIVRPWANWHRETSVYMVAVALN